MGQRYFFFGGTTAIFECLRQAEFHHRFGRDLDGFGGLRVTSHTGLAVGLDSLAQSRNHELAHARPGKADSTIRPLSTKEQWLMSRSHVRQSAGRVTLRDVCQQDVAYPKVDSVSFLITAAAN